MNFKKALSVVALASVFALAACDDKKPETTAAPA